MPSGATLGTVSGQTNRIWIAVFDNGGIPVLGVYNSLNSAGPNVLAWDETAGASPAGISAGSTSAQTWYAASSLTSKAFRILGYVESTQATAGTWATSPSKVQLFGSGMKRPGDMVQELSVINSTADSGGSGAWAVLSHSEITIPMQSAANLARVDASGSMSFTTGQTALIRWSRGTSAGSNLIGSPGVTVNGTGNPTLAM